jgi:uncharacterized coiled-coil protein SlyX
MSPIETKLAALGLVLPAPAAPGGSYLPYRLHGDTLILAGVISSFNGQMTHVGQVGKEHTIETAREAAKICALNVLTNLKLALGEDDGQRRGLNTKVEDLAQVVAEKEAIIEGLQVEVSKLQLRAEQKDAEIQSTARQLWERMRQLMDEQQDPLPPEQRPPCPVQ